LCRLDDVDVDANRGQAHMHTDTRARRLSKLWDYTYRG